MNKRMLHFTLVALVIVVAGGCAKHNRYGKNTGGEMDVTTPTGSARVVQTQPVIVSSQPIIVQPQPLTLQGQVIRNEGDAIIIQEPSGRQTRVRLDRATAMDNNIAVGDLVVVQMGGPATSHYATSVMRSSTTVVPVPMTATAPAGYRTIDGVVVEQSGNYYVIRENTGREVRLHVDNTTRLDRNIRTGDRVLITVREVPTEPVYATNVMRIDRPASGIPLRGGPNVIVGEVVRTDGNQFIIRDANGRDIPVEVDNTTTLSRDIREGDPIVALNARPAATPYDRDIYTAYKRNDPYMVQGEVIQTDGNVYVVRDRNGRDVRLMTDARTVRNEPIRVGDVIIVYGGPPATVHADSIEHR